MRERRVSDPSAQARLLIVQHAALEGVSTRSRAVVIVLSDGAITRNGRGVRAASGCPSRGHCSPLARRLSDDRRPLPRQGPSADFAVYNPCPRARGCRGYLNECHRCAPAGLRRRLSPTPPRNRAGAESAPPVVRPGDCHFVSNHRTVLGYRFRPCEDRGTGAGVLEERHHGPAGAP